MSKNYSTKSSAVAAIKKAGLYRVPHSIDLISRTWEPVFKPWLAEDYHFIKAKGFSAIFPSADRQKLGESL